MVWMPNGSIFTREIELEGDSTLENITTSIKKYFRKGTCCNVIQVYPYMHIADSDWFYQLIHSHTACHM